ncbi:protein SOB FIVE-LIKE 5-like isoform X2 [Mangifera indica]|uniref:protein SOB FIVE-LIKE 5-like isoform X2 n=1 Tax=Mangifera indica TaxID=29780 RepID=UPI001CF97D74|nr:protein SOB FIVE-LIKE 5-like isoform X2 [Mangifera indica]
MNLSSSQFSSGCESGWTLYLDQSSHSKNECYSFGGNVDEEYAQTGERLGHNEEKDLSMVSDASSGPRHCCEDEDCFDENGCFCSPPSVSEIAQKSKKKNKIKQYGKIQQHSYLDDTASSPISKNAAVSKNQASMDHVLDFSQGFSATHLKGKSKFKKHFDCFKSSLAENPASGKKAFRKESVKKIKSNYKMLFCLYC